MNQQFRWILFIFWPRTDRLQLHVEPSFGMEYECAAELDVALSQRSLERFQRHKRLRRQRRFLCFVSIELDYSTIHQPGTTPEIKN